MQREKVLPTARGFIATKAQRHEGLFLRNNKGRADWIFYELRWDSYLKGSKVQRFKSSRLDPFKV